MKQQRRRKMFISTAHTQTLTRIHTSRDYTRNICKKKIIKSLSVSNGPNQKTANAFIPLLLLYCFGCCYSYTILPMPNQCGHKLSDTHALHTHTSLIRSQLNLFFFCQLLEPAFAYAGN